MKGLWISLKRDKVWAELYYKGELVATLKVSDQNRGNMSTINLDADNNTTFKIIKGESPLLVDDAYFNKESFNK